MGGVAFVKIHAYSHDHKSTTIIIIIKIHIVSKDRKRSILSVRIS